MDLSSALTLPRDRLRPLAGRTQGLAPLAVVVFAASILFYRLGAPSLASWDEAIYAQVAKEMLETGDWVSTRFEHKLFFDKPPLIMWAEAALFQAFGMSELSARIPSALAGVGIVLLSFLLARRAYGMLAGLGAAAVLLSAAGFIFYSRFATTDAVLTFFSYLAVYGYVRARGGAQSWWLLVGAALGLAIMTKSAGTWLVIATLGIAFLVDGVARRRANPLALVGAVAVVGLIAVPWHAYMYATYGEPFFDGYVGEQIFSRSTGELRNTERAVLNEMGLLFYFTTTLPTDFFPWVFALPLGLLFAVTDRRAPWMSRMLAFLVVAGLAFYTLVPSKFPWYVFPTYPAAAILIAGFFTHGTVNARVTVALATLSALAATAIILVTHGFPAVFTQRAKLLVAGLAATAIAAMALRVRAPDLPVLRFALLVAAFFVAAGSAVALPQLQRNEDPFVVLVRTVTRTEPGSEFIFVWDSDDRVNSGTFYSNRKVVSAKDAAQMAQLLPPGRGMPAVFTKSALPAISTTCVVEPVSELGDYVYVRLSRRTP